MAGFGWASAVQIAEAIRGRQVSAAEVLAEQLERIARLDAELGAVVTLDAEGARRRAAEADRALARGEVWGPLHGVGVTIEDIHATAGMRSTFGGYRPFASYVPGGGRHGGSPAEGGGGDRGGQDERAVPVGAGQRVPARPGTRGIRPGRPGAPRPARRWRWPRA